MLISERGGKYETYASKPGGDTDVMLEVYSRQHIFDSSDNDPTNLIVLCQRCHRRHHGNQDSEAAYQQLGLDETNVTPDIAANGAVERGDSATDTVG